MVNSKSRQKSIKNLLNSKLKPRWDNPNLNDRDELIQCLNIYGFFVIRANVNKDLCFSNYFLIFSFYQN